MPSSPKLPRGIWFDVDKQKYRVRVYRDGRAYTPKPSAFFDTVDEAEVALAQLKAIVSRIPRSRVGEDIDLTSLWKRCVGSAAFQRIDLTIDADSVP